MELNLFHRALFDAVFLVYLSKVPTETLACCSIRTNNG